MRLPAFTVSAIFVVPILAGFNPPFTRNFLQQLEDPLENAASRLSFRLPSPVAPSSLTPYEEVHSVDHTNSHTYGYFLEHPFAVDPGRTQNVYHRHNQPFQSTSLSSSETDPLYNWQGAGTSSSPNLMQYRVVERPHFLPGSSSSSQFKPSSSRMISGENARGDQRNSFSNAPSRGAEGFDQESQLTGKQNPVVPAVANRSAKKKAWRNSPYGMETRLKAMAEEAEGIDLEFLDRLKKVETPEMTGLELPNRFSVTPSNTLDWHVAQWKYEILGGRFTEEGRQALTVDEDIKQNFPEHAKAYFTSNPARNIYGIRYEGRDYLMTWNPYAEWTTSQRSNSPQAAYFWATKYEGKELTLLGIHLFQKPQLEKFENYLTKFKAYLSNPPTS